MPGGNRAEQVTTTWGKDEAVRAELVGSMAGWGFWTALSGCAYGYFGYPLLLGLAARWFGRGHRVGEALPSVTLLIPAHNEAKVIAAKIENSLRLDYPAERLQIRVISDGSGDGTDEIVRRYLTAGVELQRIAVRSGKPNALNAAAPFARGEILLLCDANTMFAADAVRRLVRHFADPTVGAVTGDVRLRSETVRYGEGEGLFYRLERFLQRCESRVWTTIGVDGGMYALRKEYYVPNRSDTLIDDFVIAMNVARAGARVIYEPEAAATEDAVQQPMQEFRRRVRTTAGGFQSLLEGLGRPRWNQPGLWLGYLSHKVLRWLGPFLLLVLLACSIAGFLSVRAGSAHWYGYGVALVLQGAFYLLGLAGWLWGKTSLPRWVCVPYYFLLGNAAALVGFLKWCGRGQSVTWAQADRNVIAGVGDPGQGVCSDGPGAAASHEDRR